MKTKSANPADVERAWYVVDLQGKTLGRAATQIANVLRGKHKPTFTPHVDTGDFVIIVNADKVVLTGTKIQKKLYQYHTGWPGGLRTASASQRMEKHPERLVYDAIQGMVPKNALGRRILKKLKIYNGAEHPHAAQQPQPLHV